MKRRVHIHVGDSSLATWGKLGAAGPSTPERVLQTLLPGSVQVHLHQSQTLARSVGAARDAQRLIDTITDGSAVAKIYRDVEWEEFVVKLYVNGVYQSKADYHTDDKSDATSSARDMVRRAKENAGTKDSFPMKSASERTVRNKLSSGEWEAVNPAYIDQDIAKGTIMIRVSEKKRGIDNVAGRTFMVSVMDSAHTKDCGCTDTCDCMNYDAAFSASMIEQLRSEYSRIDKVDPEGESFKKLRALLDRLDQAQLKQLASAGIKFVSNLARNRVTRDDQDTINGHKVFIVAKKNGYELYQSMTEKLFFVTKGNKLLGQFGSEQAARNYIGA